MEENKISREDIISVYCNSHKIVKTEKDEKRLWVLSVFVNIAVAIMLSFQAYMLFFIVHTIAYWYAFGLIRQEQTAAMEEIHVIADRIIPEEMPAETKNRLLLEKCKEIIEADEDLKKELTEYMMKGD